MANYKVPSQAASGADSFSDNLVGNQFTTDSSLMTGANFIIEKSIPEKDSKQFITQPFSDFLTLDDLKEETSTTTDGTTSTSNEGDIKFNNDKQNADRSLYGSLKQRIGVAITNIISKYPAAILVDSSSPIGVNSLTAEQITYDPITNTTEFQVQYSLLYNPFGIVLRPPKSNVIPETDNTIRNFFSSYTKYSVEVSGATYNISHYIEPDSDNRITLRVEGHCFAGYIGYYSDYLIRPNNGIVENFYDELDDLERVLVNRETYPKFNAGFNVPRDTNDGYTTETITEYINWPISKDEWNIQIVGLDYDYYVEKVSSLAEEVDDYKSNLIVRFLTSPQLYEFDTEEKKIESIFQIYGQSFDSVKKFIDNIAYMRNVSYDGINNVPDVLLKNLAETLGLSTVSLFDEKSLQDSLYTRHDQQYAGVPTGINLIEAEYEFYRRLLVNLAWLYKSKGTRTAIEFFLKFIGAPEPMIRLNEFVYKVDGPLPSRNVEDDIRDAIQGVKITNIVSYDETISGYTLTQLTGSTTLTRSEYPVDEETGLPKSVEYPDGTMFFEKGAGWFRKTLDHRSPDIIDTANSDLTSRVKIIKTMSKPFTYGEDYFDLFRQLPGLDYGYTLSTAIDNRKIEVVEDENISKLTLNRKNINVFLAADGAIDYDIYRKSRDLMLTFGSLVPQTGVTFAEFMDNISNTIIHDSHVIKYKNTYTDLFQVYNAYEQNNQFTPYNYVAVNEFVNRLSPYWVNIIEQFIPATTLWTGGNVIENGIFNRSKFKHRQPCLPSTYTHDLYPDFGVVISEDLETILGGGTIGGVDNSANFRGLQIFGGLTFDMILEVNGLIYSGSTGNLAPFSPFVSTAACTVLTSSTSSIPLICDYTDLLTTTDPGVIESIKNEWKAGLTGFTHDLNLIFTGATGQTINIEFFLDTDDVEQVKFTIIPHEYYGCTGYETFEYYFEPAVMLSGSTGNEAGNCELEVATTAISNIYTTDVSACQLIADIQFSIQGVGDESGVAGQGSFYIRTGCTENSDNVSACTHTIPNVLETNQFDLIFTDAANCEQKIKFNGLQLVIVHPEGYAPEYTGITAYPIIAYKPTYNYGIEWGTMIYSGSTQPATKDELQAAITGGSIVEVPVESIVSGSTILAVQLKSYSDMTAQNFIDAPLSGYSFAYNYRLVTVTDIDCLTTTKISVINGIFNVLPTSKLLVYTNMDLDLNTISYHFDYKYPEDLFVRDGTQTGDYLINELGYLTEITGVTLNICSVDNYSTLYSQINFADSIDGTPNILFNGNTGTGNKIVVSFIDKEIDPLTFNLRQYFIRDGIGEGDPINTVYYRDFTAISGYTSCASVPLPTPSVSSSPGSSITPTQSRTPSRTPSYSPLATPTQTPTTTPSISVSSSVTPSLSVSSTQTPSLSVSSTQTPSLSVSSSITPTRSPSNTIGYTPSATPTRSITPTMTQTPSVTPTMTQTPSITPSSTPAADAPSIFNFSSLNGNDAIMGISGVTAGRTFSITFDYRISANVDNVWSNGMDPVQATTYFYVSIDGGVNWTEVDYVTAQIPGNGPPDESMSDTISGSYTIPVPISGTSVSQVMVRGQYDCAWAQNAQGGEVEITITDVDIVYTATGGGYTIITCNNKYLAACLQTTALSCGPGVTPSLTPTITTSRSVTPTPSTPQYYFRLNRCIDNNSNFYARSLFGTYLSSGTGVWGAINCDPNYAYVVIGSTQNESLYSGYTDIGQVSVSVYNACYDCNNNPITPPPSPPAYSTVTLIRKSGAAMCGLPIYEGDDIHTAYIYDVPVDYGTLYNVYDTSWNPFDGGNLYWGIVTSGETIVTKTVYITTGGALSTWASCTVSTPTPTPSRTPSRTPGAPIYIEFNLSNGTIDFSGLGGNTISLQIRATATASQIWRNCDPLPEAYANYVYMFADQLIHGEVTENSATSYNPNTESNDVQTYTFTNVTSGSITIPNVTVNHDIIYCGDSWGTVELEMLSLVVTSGGGNVQIGSNSTYTFTSSVVPTPSVTPSRSISRTPTPSLSISKTPSKTPSITPSLSRTPSSSPAAIFINITNDSQDNTIDNITVSGSDVYDVTPAFPYYPSDNGIARSPYTGGWRSIGVYLGGSGNAKYATLIDSAGGSYCVNIDAGSSYTLFPTVYMSTSNPLYLVLHNGGSCPSPTPTMSRTPSITPSISFSRTTTPSPTPSRSISASTGVSITPTPTKTPTRSISASPVYSASLSPTSLNYLQNGNPYTVDTTYLTTSGGWYGTVISDPDNIVADFIPHSSSGSTNVTVGVVPGDGSPGTSAATIRFTCGTAIADLSICRDGSSFTCI